MSYEEAGLESVSALSETAFDTRAEARVLARRPQAPCAAPPICYVDEADVEAMIRCDELGGETLLAADLGAPRDAAERARLVRGVLRILGFQSLAYLTVTLDKHGSIDRAYLLRNECSSHLIQRMLHTRFLERSMPLRAALTGHAPQRWDIKTLMSGYRWRSECVQQDRQLLDAMREDGLCSGLAFGLPISGTSLRSIVILASPREVAADWLTERIVVQCLTLGLSLHQRCAAYLRAAQRRDALGALSPMQQQIVALLVQGLSDKEIALRLNMTAFNVDYHLRQLKERYGALNRSHLAFIVGSPRSARD